MILLSLLQHFENEGLGTIDDDLCWGKMGLDHDGIYIAELGGSQNRGTRRNMSYQIFSRGANDVQAYKRLETIRQLLVEAYGEVCELPAVVDQDGVEISEGFNNVLIATPSTISNDGLDAQGRTMYSIIGTIYY